LPVPQRNNTPLIQAALSGNLEIVECLTEHGADVNRRDMVSAEVALHDHLLHLLEAHIFAVMTANRKCSWTGVRWA